MKTSKSRCSKPAYGGSLLGDGEKVIHAGDILPIPPHAPHAWKRSKTLLPYLSFLLSATTGVAGTMRIYVNRKLHANSSTQNGINTLAALSVCPMALALSANPYLAVDLVLTCTEILLEH
jgi:hypothetical protein